MVSTVSQTAWVNCTCVFSWSHGLRTVLSSLSAMSPFPKWRGENPFMLKVSCSLDFISAIELKYCFNSLNYRYLEKMQRVLYCGLFFIGLFCISYYCCIYAGRGLYFSLWSPQNCPDSHLPKPPLWFCTTNRFFHLHSPEVSLEWGERLCSFLAGDVIDLKVKVFTVIVFSKCSSSTPKWGYA